MKNWSAALVLFGCLSGVVRAQSNEAVVVNLPAQKIGAGPHGTRLAVPIAGGQFEGPRLRGKVLPRYWTRSRGVLIPREIGLSPCARKRSGRSGGDGAIAEDQRGRGEAAADLSATARVVDALAPKAGRKRAQGSF